MEFVALKDCMYVKGYVCGHRPMWYIAENFDKKEMTVESTNHYIGTCRENLVSRFRGLSRTNYEPKKTNLIMRYKIVNKPAGRDAPFVLVRPPDGGYLYHYPMTAFEKPKRKDVEERLDQAMLNIKKALNLLEKYAGWKYRTSFYKVLWPGYKYPKRTTTIGYLSDGPKQWCLTPHTISLYALLMRTLIWPRIHQVSFNNVDDVIDYYTLMSNQIKNFIGFANGLYATPTAMPLFIKEIPDISRIDAREIKYDSKHIAATVKYWKILLKNYDKMYSNNIKLNYGKDKISDIYGRESTTEGITMLMDCFTTDKNKRTVFQEKFKAFANEVM